MAKKTKKLAMALASWADDVIAEIGKELVEMHAVDQGVLMAATTRTPVTQQGPKIKVTIFNPMEYAVIVEFGRMAMSGKPPPLLPIVAWAVRKGIVTTLPVNMSFGDAYAKQWAASGAILRNMGKGASKSGKKKPMDPMVLDLLKVRLIAKKIYEQGIEGRHPFAKAWDRKSATFKQDIAKMVQ